MHFHFHFFFFFFFLFLNLFSSTYLLVCVVNVCFLMHASSQRRYILCVVCFLSLFFFSFFLSLYVCKCKRVSYIRVICYKFLGTFRVEHRERYLVIRLQQNYTKTMQSSAAPFSINILIRQLSKNDTNIDDC